MKNLNICAVRLREKVKYEKPLIHIMDSFYELYKRFMNIHSEFDYNFYNITFDSSTPKRDLDQVKKSDIILIFTEHEFHYHIPGYFHTLSMKRSNEHIKELLPYIENKHVILITSDRADTEELYRNYTFRDIDFKCSVIDENDFTMNIHGMKFWGFREEGFPTYKDIDFCYWGTMKNKMAGGSRSNDERHKILKDIQQTDLRTWWIGRYPNMKCDMKFDSLLYLTSCFRNSRSTLCFNWLDNKATTSRYHEAIASYMIPFVWKDYDSTGILVKDDWQRIASVSELVDKIKDIKNDLKFVDRYLKIKSTYKIPSVDQYYEEFEKLLLGKIYG